MLLFQLRLPCYVISFPKQDGRALRRLSGYISPRSTIRHLRVRGRGIHQNSLCSTRYTKEPLRISDSVLCLWLSTLRPISSSPRSAWREFINHSSRLTEPPLTHSTLYLLSFIETFTCVRLYFKVWRFWTLLFCCFWLNYNISPYWSRLLKETVSCEKKKKSLKLVFSLSYNKK